MRGVASNYMCDLKVSDEVRVIGPFGASFLMPNHPRSSIVMICTGTGSAPMRAMTEWRRRLRQSGKFEAGKLMLFFGARTQEELPYFGPLQNLPKDFIDINFAFSRIPGSPKLYVQDLMRERASDLGPMLADPDCYFYVCGLKSMEQGVQLFKQTASACAPAAKDCKGLFMVGIPYRGGGPMLNDILAGTIKLMFINQDAALPHVRAGKLRALAVTSAQRNPLYPDVPTIAESGYNGFEALSWSGLSAIKGAPQPIVARLEAAMAQVMQSDAVKQRMGSVGFIIPPQGSRPYNDFVKSEIDTWSKVIKTAGIKPE